MKYHTLIFSLLLLTKCTTEKKQTVLVADIKNGKKLHWYYYSEITNYSPDHVDFVNENCDEKLIFKAHRITNVSFDSDTVHIECFHCDTLYIDANLEYTVSIKDTTNYKGLIDYRKRTKNISRKFYCKR